VHPGRRTAISRRLERSADSIKFVDRAAVRHPEVLTKIDPVTGRPSYNEEAQAALGRLVTFCPGSGAARTGRRRAKPEGASTSTMPGTRETSCIARWWDKPTLSRIARTSRADPTARLEPREPARGRTMPIVQPDRKTGRMAPARR